MVFAFRAVKVYLSGYDDVWQLFNNSVHASRMLSHFNRGQKTTPTSGASKNCRSGLLTAIKHWLIEKLLTLRWSQFSLAIGDEVMEQIRIERLEFSAQAHRL